MFCSNVHIAFEPFVDLFVSFLIKRFNYESSSESTGYPESHRLLTRKLDHMERLNSIESSVSDLSDFSR